MHSNNINNIKKELKELLGERYEDFFKYDHLRDIQLEALKYVFNDTNLIVSAPTGSGKTWIAFLYALVTIVRHKKKVLYTAPLKALASEKYEEFKKFGLRTTISTGDFDTSGNNLKKYDVIFTTTEKLDSLIRHRTNWLNEVGLLIVDEIHLINEPSRGPIVELVIAFFDFARIVGLSATISNAEEIAEWLNAVLIKSDQRPVKLKFAALKDGTLYYEK